MTDKFVAFHVLLTAAQSLTCHIEDTACDV